MRYNKPEKEGFEMLKKNIKTQRKIKGLTQEELAIRLNVVRQTVSKWEKGQSVPDADLLIQMADIFELSVSELLGTEIENDKEIGDVAQQLSRINEQLAIINRRARRVWKTIAIIAGSFLVLSILLILSAMIITTSELTVGITEVTTYTTGYSDEENVRHISILVLNDYILVDPDSHEISLSTENVVQFFARIEPLGLLVDIIWIISDSGVLEIIDLNVDSTEATIKAISPGTAHLTVLAGDKSETVTINVFE